jgi:uncharacterized membrane protein HdeD (DUF308 family)
MGQIAKNVQSTGRRMTAFGLISIVVGIASIAAPLVTGVSIVVTVGIFVIAAGILRMMWAFGAGSFGSGMLAFAIGGLTLLCGLSLVSDPIFAFGFLTVLIAIYLLVDGGRDRRAFRLAPGPADVDDCGSHIDPSRDNDVGAVSFRRLGDGIFLGIKLLSIGFAILMVGTGVRTVAKGLRRSRRNPEIHPFGA